MAVMMAAAGVLLTACASPFHGAEVARRETAATDSCIRAEALAEWEPLDDQSLLVFEPRGRRAHLIRLAAPVEGLMLAHDIMAVDGDLDGLICPQGVDGIYVEECGCASSDIVSIEYLSEKRTAELTGNAPIVLTLPASPPRSTGGWHGWRQAQHVHRLSRGTHGRSFEVSLAIMRMTGSPQQP
jgi:hypothetical protein